MRLVVSLVLVAASLSPALADDRRESAFRGRRLAEANCAACHALARADASPLAAAPPLREIGRRMPVAKLCALLRGAVFLKHAVMPDFEPGEMQADDLATYIRSIASLE